MQNQMKLDAEIFDADLNENRCKFARQPIGFIKFLLVMLIFMDNLVMN